MALSLSSISSAASDFRTQISNAAGQLNNATSQITAALRQPNSNNISSSLRDIGGLANQVLGSNNNIAKGINQVNSAVSVVSRLSGALQTTTKIDANRFSLTNALSSAFNATGLGPLAKNLDQLASIGAQVAGASAAFNNVAVVNRSEQEIKGAVGGVFDQARQYIESFKPDAMSIGDAVYNALGDPSPPANVGYALNSEGRVENPLRYHNHYNYIITLGILDSSQLSDPASYRSSNGFKQILLRSGGGSPDGGYNNRIRTSHEGNENAEYYIDDIDIGAVVAPNPNTGAAQGTSITFKIIEPYSMGKLIEAMLVGSAACGYSSYNDAPFCLKIEFYGWDSRGQRKQVLARPGYIPIKIVEMQLETGSQGSVYACKAVPYSEVALSDTVNKTRVPISARGDTVHSILENGKKSVTYTVNGQIEKLEEKEIIKGYDRYVIVFPKSRDDLNKALQAANVNLDVLRAAQNASDQERIRLGVGDPPKPTDPDTPAQVIPVVAASAPNQYLYLKSYAGNPQNMNAWGRSLIVEDTRDGGDVSFAAAGSQQNSDTRTMNRNHPEASVPEKGRVFTFNQGTNITEIITEVLKKSAYAKEVGSAPSKNGFKETFRIETLVFAESGGTAIEQQIGRPRRTYVYAVHPFWTHEARHLGPNQRPKGIKELKKLAKKEYNYIYTGTNEDILKFDIKFNNSFYQNMRADLGQGSSTTIGQEVTSSGRQPGTQLADTGDRTSGSPRSEPQSAVELTGESKASSSGGTRVYNVDDKVKAAIFEQFYNRVINSPIDMISAEMEIWGDPYYLPLETGNAAGKPSQPGITEDGAMAYIKDEVFVLINFKTPLDYFIYGSRMDIPKNIKSFSGLYQVISTTSNFSGGVFKQTLKLIRVPNQNEESTENSSGVFQTGANSQVPDPARNANPNPNSAPVSPPTGSSVQQVTNVNTNASSGVDASFSQIRLMTGEPASGTTTINNSGISTIAGAFANDPTGLANLALSTATRLGIAANLSQTVFPVKFPDPTAVIQQAAPVVASVQQAANLVARGLNGPVGPTLTNISQIVQTVSSLPSSLNGAASQAVNRIQTTANSAASAVTTQARAAGLRPPVGPQ